jgi:predicted phage tail component-like protein
VTATVATFDGNPSTGIAGLEILGVARPFLGDLRDERVEMPGRLGTYQFAEEDGDGLLTIRCHILGGSLDLRRQAVRDTAAWARSRRPKRLSFSDETDRYYVAKLDSRDRPEEWLLAAEFDLTFRCYPFALASTISTEAWTASDNVPHTWSLSDEVDADCEVEITAGSAITGGFTLTCNGVDLVYGTTVSAAGVVTISSVSTTVFTGVSPDTELEGVYVDANLSFVDVSGEFPILVPGVNSVTVNTANGVGCGVVVRHRRRYV